MRVNISRLSSLFRKTILILTSICKCYLSTIHIKIPAHEPTLKTLNIYKKLYSHIPIYYLTSGLSIPIPNDAFATIMLTSPFNHFKKLACFTSSES